MLLPSSNVAVYSIDTSCLIDLENRYPSRVFPALWGIVRQLADDSRLFVCRQVEDEIDGRRHPEVLTLLGDFGHVLVDLPDFEWHFRALMSFLAGSGIVLTKPSAERTEADPFVIALALRLAGRDPRDPAAPQSSAREAVVVTDESVASSKKIPAVCGALNLPCCSLVRLLERENYRGQLGGHLHEGLLEALAVVPAVPEDDGVGAARAAEKVAVAPVANVPFSPRGGLTLPPQDTYHDCRPSRREDMPRGAGGPRCAP